jgi:predicted nuclease of predicted toxin-antitoxin system
VKFKLDENLPELVHTTLVALGHDAHTAAGEQLAGAADDQILAASVAEARVLITLDLDFSDIRAYPPGSHAGIWVLRPSKQAFRAIEALVLSGLRLADTERVQGQLWVIDELRVRIRDA